MAPTTNLNMTIRLLSRRLREDQHQGVTKLGKCITIPAGSLHHRAAACRVLGNSGKPVTLETLSLIKYQVWLANTVPVKKKMESGECVWTSPI
jgi:hypothetical protein